MTFPGTLPEDSGDVDDDSEKPSPSIASYYTTVKEGESASLLCAFQGVPYPTYSLLCAFQGVPYPTYRWYFSNKTEISDVNTTFSYQYEKQVLQMNSVTRDLAGLFLCQGTNVAGSSVINITLFVDYSEELGFAEDLVEEMVFTQGKGKTTEIICKGEGTPPLDIRWYGEDNTLLSSDPILQIDLSELQNMSTTCVVENKNGTVRQSTRVTVVADEDTTDPTKGVVATVECYGDRMVLSLTERRNVAIFHLFDSECEFLGESQEIVTPLERCGTKAYYNDSHIIYKNQVTGVANGGVESGSLISRGDNFHITFECAYKRTGNTDNVAWEARGQITVDIKGAGSFTFVLDLYESSNFTMKRDSSQYPVRLSVQDDIYLEVALISPDENLSLQIADIRASDSPSGSGGSFAYSLVENGCIVDSTFKYIETNNLKKRRFTLKAFHFMSSQSVVYLHAFVKICNKSSNSCSDICITDRIQRRSLDEAAEEGVKEYHIFQGPFVTFDSSRLTVVSGAGRLVLSLPFLFLLILTS
ncbi:ZP domain-containing protein-like [Bolinopsis microptera]|uniref:ZP domain-containing protein-like n=1 Tax=Bolinopsis microptera TaxID=2820187 RepID=UPI00307AB3F7